MPMSITIPSAALREAVTAVNRLSTLVPVAKGQIADVYVVLIGQAGTSNLYIEHSRNGLRIRYKLNGATVRATTPTVMLCVELNFLSALKAADDVVFTRNDHDTTVSFVQGRSKGFIALTPPNSFLAPAIPAPTSSIKIPVDVVRAGLQATVFATSDPTLSGTGVLSSVLMQNGELSVVTYDSMCGAVYKRSGDALYAEIPDGFALTLPNQMINILFSQADVPEMAVSIDAGSMRFRTPNIDVSFPRIDYPLLPVEASIRQFIATAEHQIDVDVLELNEAVLMSASFLSVDKEANTIIINVNQTEARITVKSVKVGHACNIAVENKSGTAFQFACDINRLQTFLRLVKGYPKLNILFSNHRIIFQVPSAIYALAES